MSSSLSSPSPSASSSFPFNSLPPELRLEIWAFAVRDAARRRLVVEQDYQIFPTLNLVASPFFSINSESRDAARSVYRVRLPVYRKVEEEKCGSPVICVNSSPASAGVGVGVGVVVGTGDGNADLWSDETEMKTKTKTAALTVAEVVEVTADENEDDEDEDEDAGEAANSRRGTLYLNPDMDTMVSLHPRTRLRGLYDMNFFGSHIESLVFDRSRRSKMVAWLHRTSPAHLDEPTRRLFQRHPNRYCLMRHASERLGVREWEEVRQWVLGFGADEYRGALKLLRSMRLNSWEFAEVFGW